MVICKICNPTLQGNGYCANHSTGGSAYKIMETENIKLKISQKFWNENGKWCVAVQLPCEYWECWSESCWDKNREKAYEQVMKLVKKHIDWVREFKKSAEQREEILTY